MENAVFSDRTSGDKGKPFLLVAAIFALIAIVMAELLGGKLGTLDISTLAFFIVGILFILVLAWRQYQLAVVMVVAAHVYVDWYLGYQIVGLVVALGLLVFLFVIRSPRYPWIMPRAKLLWVLFLILTVSPIIRGAQSRSDVAYYYLNDIVGSLVMFSLGLLVASNKMRLKTLFQLLALFGALLAIHTIIQTTTGITVLYSSRFNQYLAQVANFGLSNSDIHRSGSFLANPDWNGTFFALMFFLPLGLFAKATSFLEKFLYFVEMLLMLIALLFTYSIGAWIGALAGILAFVLFVGRSYYRILVPVLVVILGMILVLLFPTEINAQFQHASNPLELSLRSGAWQTAINIIQAFPWTGIGFGLNNYLQHQEPYSGASQYLPSAHPHESYLELGAMAGLPVLLVFLALLFFALWRAWRNWIVADAGTRCLLGGGIGSIIALSVNSLSINGWTLPPLAAIGWLILGAIASTFATRKQPSEMIERKNLDI